MKKGIVILMIFVLTISIMPVQNVFANDTNYSIRDTFNSNNYQQSLVNKIKEVLNKGENYFREKIKRFSDMGTHWADITVGKLVELGIIAGYNDDTFKPNNTITRAEFAKITRTALKLELVEGNSFQDTSNHWAKNDIHTLVVNGGIDKAEYGINFEPNKNITRIEMAKMIVRSLELTEQAKAQAGVKTQFSDDGTIPNSDKGYIIIASENKIINGYPDKTFKPYGEATRAEASQMIINMLNAIPNIDNNNQQQTEEEETVQRVNETLQERDTEIRLPNNTDSVAKNPNPETYEELVENIKTLKVYPFTTSPKTDWDLIAVSQFISNDTSWRFTERMIGAIRMEFPNIDTDLDTLNFNGKTYDILHADDLIKKGFNTGLLIKDGEILEQFVRIGMFNERTTTQPYYSLGLSEHKSIEKADYIAFTRYSEDIFTSSSKYDQGKGDIVLIVFENPFKK